jgi:hypothetical protein
MFILKMIITYFIYVVFILCNFYLFIQSTSNLHLHLQIKLFFLFYFKELVFLLPPIH